MDTLEQRIQRHEGLRLKPYHDDRGFLTIGYGRNLQAKGVSEDEALLMLRNDIAMARNQLIGYFPWVSTLDDIRQEVLTEMVFQLGINGVAAFKNTLAHAQAGEWDAAADG